jgi:hypothetical protein
VISIIDDLECRNITINSNHEILEIFLIEKPSPLHKPRGEGTRRMNEGFTLRLKDTSLPEKPYGLFLVEG